MSVHIDYHAYLRSPEWAERRRKAVTRAGGTCQICDSDHRLNVHHRTYLRLGDEKPMDLTVLCEHCHKLVHDKLPTWGPDRAAERNAHNARLELVARARRSLRGTR